MDPLELRGPAFLALYAALLVGAALLSAWLRWTLRAPSGRAGPAELQLGPLEAALLAGGAGRAFDAAVVRLEAAGLLTVEPFDRSLCPRGPRPREGTPLERAILDAAGPPPGRPIDQVRKVATGAALTVAEARLSALGLRPARTGFPLLPLLPLLTVGALGLAKLVVGLSRDRPVVGLVLLLVVTVVVMVGVARLGGQRSLRGDDALRQLQRRNDGLRGPTPEAAPADLSLAVALFGVTALADTHLAPLALALHPPPPASTDSSGGSSCGSSSSCGGGGCGGGGCGGCGS